MGRRADNVVLIEPVIKPVTFVTGIKVTMENNHVIVTGWVRLAETDENRIELRFAMLNPLARDMLAQLTLGIAKGDGHI